MPKAKTGQREKAYNVVRNMDPSTVGGAIAPLLKPYAAIAPKFCAGNIGDFYERNRHLLELKATDENIRLYANKETAYLRLETGCTYGFGLLYTAEGRFQAIRDSRDNLIRP